MPIISRYVDPGTYLSEVVAPAAVNVQTLPILPTIIAAGSRSKRVLNEDIQRGFVSGETLTVAGSAPYVATLSGRGDRKSGNTTVFADGIPVNADYISYVAATVTGSVTGPFDLSTNNAIQLSLDGQRECDFTLSV